MKKDFEKKLTTKELEAFVKKQEQLDSKSGRDSIIMWSLLLIGIAGLFIVLRSSNLSHNSKSESISKKKISTNKNQIARAEVAIPILKEKSANTVVRIKGIKEASELIHFEVEGYQKNANYRFDFGDGIGRTMNAPIVKHAYQNPGKYDVKLVVSYKNETKVLYQNSITKYLFISSTSVYQNSKNKITEKSKIEKTNNPYIKGKIAVENFLINKSKNFPYIILRICQVYGENNIPTLFKQRSQTVLKDMYINKRIFLPQVKSNKWKMIGAHREDTPASNSGSVYTSQNDLIFKNDFEFDLL